MAVTFVQNKRQSQVIKQITLLADRFNGKSVQFDELGEFPSENINDLKKCGYTSYTVPKQFGGEGISLYDFVLFQEKLAQGDASTALSIGWHLGIVMDIRERNNWKKDKLAFIFGEVLQGRLLNRAATEPHTGSPTRGGKPQTKAKKLNNKWILTGRKTFTTMSPVLDYFLVSAAIDETNEVGEFLVHRNKTGVNIEETWDTISMRGTGSHDLILENVLLAEDDLVEIYTPNRKDIPSGWLLHIPACYLGIAIAAKNFAVNFASNYSPNSLQGPIKNIPNVQRLVGEMEAELISARHLMYAVAQKWDSNLEDRGNLSPELGVVKYVATNTAISIVDKAMRVVGAQSLQRKNPLQRYYRDVRAGLHNPPMDDMTIAKLAKQAFDEIDD